MELHSANATSFLLKKPSETSAPETLQQTRHPSPAMEEREEAGRVTFRSLKTRKEEKWGWAECWDWQLGCPGEAPAASILVAVVHASSCQSGPTAGMLLGEAHAILFHQWAIQLQERKSLKGRMKKSHSKCLRLRRSAYTVIAMNIVCFDLKQLSCLPTGKGLHFLIMKIKQLREENKRKII